MPIYKINYGKCKKPFVYNNQICNIQNYHCLDKSLLIDIGKTEQNKYLYCYNIKGLNPKKKE